MIIMVCKQFVYGKGRVNLTLKSLSHNIKGLNTTLLYWQYKERKKNLHTLKLIIDSKCLLQKRWTLWAHLNRLSHIVFLDSQRSKGCVAQKDTKNYN